MGDSRFEPPFWLRNAHAQTVLGRLTRSRRLVALRREVLETPDGDDLVLDHLDAAPSPVHYLLMHGLEGSSYSVYIQGMLSMIASRGLSATAINFRSCARDPGRLSRMLPNRKPRFYHSGETSDLDFVIETLTSRWPNTTIVAAGASLGGNALLKWLGEHPGQTKIAAAATISVPYDLGAGARHMDATASGRFYIARFLGTLKKKVERLADDFPDVGAKLDIPRIRRSRTFQEFDETATAPLHGFGGADDYYERSSSARYLPAITTPTLCISAKDDPFLPPEVLARVEAIAPECVRIVTTETGGHVGFISRNSGGGFVFWAERMIVEWLAQRGVMVASA